MQRTKRRHLLGRLVGACAVVAAMVLCALALPQRAEAAAPSWYPPNDQKTLYWIKDCPYCGCSHAVNRIYIDMDQYDRYDPGEGDFEGAGDVGVRTTHTGNITTTWSGSDLIVSADKGPGTGTLTIFASDGSQYNFEYNVVELNEQQIEDTLSWSGAHPNLTQGVKELNEYHLSLIGDSNNSQYPRTVDVSQRIGSSTFRNAARTLLSNETYKEGLVYTLDDGKDYVFNGWDWPVDDPDATMTADAFGAGTSTTDPATGMTIIDHTLTIKANFTPVEESGQQPGGTTEPGGSTEPAEQDTPIASASSSSDKGASATITATDDALTAFLEKSGVDESNLELLVENAKPSADQQAAITASKSSSTLLGTYDISLYDSANGTKVSLDSTDGLKLTVRLSLTAEMQTARSAGKTLTVYYLPDDGSAPQAMKTWFDGDCICFTTDHLSTYIVMASDAIAGGGAAGGQQATGPQQTTDNATDESVTDAKDDKPTAAKLPATDDASSMCAVLAFMAVAAFAGAYALKR